MEKFLTHAELTNLMLTGPLHSQRKRIWMQVTGASAQLQDNSGYYQLLLKSRGDTITPFTIQIDKDLQRTFPEEDYFDSPRTVESLRNVLVAYSCRNPSIGYCQGMNFIAGRLLSFGLSEEEAFWVLSQILETYLPLDYFSVMTGVLTDQKVFHSLLKLHVPRVAKHLQLHGIDPSMYCVQWFVCIFAYSFRREVVLRVWDVFFVEGSAFLFRVGLGLLHLCRDSILAIDNEEDLILALERLTKTIVDPDEILQAASVEKLRLKGKHIKALREQYRTQVLTNMGLDSAPLPVSGPLSIANRLTRSSSFLVLSSMQMLVIDDYLLSDESRREVEVGPTLKHHPLIGRKSRSGPRDVRRQGPPFEIASEEVVSDDSTSQE